MACAAMRLPILSYLSWHVFFGRGSFPDVAETGVRIQESECNPANPDPMLNF